MKFDYLIVGAGFAGSVMAERMAQANRKVLLIDQRDHIGGNAHDYYNEHGILVHAYGPHLFHTNSKDVFHYLSRFTGWRHYQHRVLSVVDGVEYPFPINIDTVNKYYGVHLQESTFYEFMNQLRPPFIKPHNTKNAIIAAVGTELYQKFYEGYTRKQWGVDASCVPAAVGKRIPVRNNHDDRYFTDEFQFMPKDGYTKMFENMLDHKNIKVELGANFQSIKNRVEFDRLIYTGSVDSYYNYCFGGLPYRSLMFTHNTIEAEKVLPAAQMNYPDIDIPYTRAYEHKQFTGQQHAKTTITHEFPCGYKVGQNTPFYPVRDDEGTVIWRKYQTLMDADKKVLFTGRLGSFRYYNMDQVVAQSLKLTKDLI